MFELTHSNEHNMSRPPHRHQHKPNLQQTTQARNQDCPRNQASTCQDFLKQKNVTHLGVFSLDNDGIFKNVSI